MRFNSAIYLDLGAFKTDDEIRPLAISRDPDPMPWVETGRDHALILCNALLESGNELFASFRVGDDSRAQDPVSMEITFGRFLLGIRIQGQKFKAIGLFEYRRGRCRNLVLEVTAGIRDLSGPILRGRWRTGRHAEKRTTARITVTEMLQGAGAPLTFSDIGYSSPPLMNAGPSGISGCGGILAQTCWITTQRKRKS